MKNMKIDTLKIVRIISVTMVIVAVAMVGVRMVQGNKSNPSTVSAQSSKH